MVWLYFNHYKTNIIMKNLLFLALLFVSFFLYSCGKGTENSQKEAEVKAEVQKLDSLNQSLQESVDDIQKSTEELKDAVDALEGI